MRLKDFVVVAPDGGYAENAAAVAKKLRAPHAWIEKRRKTNGFGKEDWCEDLGFSGKVEGQNAAIVDDEISSGGTVVEAAKTLKKNGAKKIYVFATHPVFSEKTYKSLPKAPLEKIVVTDTIPLEKKAFAKLPNLKVVSVANLLAEEIKK